MIRAVDVTAELAGLTTLNGRSASTRRLANMGR